MGYSARRGFTNGKGDHINLTVSEYISRYVYNEDYQNAPVVSIDEIVASGNALLMYDNK